MPRSTDEILAHADELAKQFEDYEPDPGDREKVSPETRLRLAALKRAEVEREVKEAVVDARVHDLSWAKIGGALGTSGQSANERYAKDVEQMIRTAFSKRDLRKVAAKGGGKNAVTKRTP